MTLALKSLFSMSSSSSAFFSLLLLLLLFLFLFLFTNHELEKHKHGFLNFILFSSIKTPKHVKRSFSRLREGQAMTATSPSAPAQGLGFPLMLTEHLFVIRESKYGSGNCMRCGVTGWKLGRTLTIISPLLIFQSHQKFMWFAQVL